jgi:hypothetical protein
MDARMMEVLVFVDGVDAMTSKVMQARRNYVPSEMMLNEQVGWSSEAALLAATQVQVYCPWALMMVLAAMPQPSSRRRHTEGS